MRMWFWILAIFILYGACTSSQRIAEQVENEVSRDYFIKGNDISHFGIDAVGNIFVVEQERILKKYSNEGELVNTYDAQSVSFIHSVDVNNALYILVYYRDAGNITMLDRNLAVLNNLEISRWTQDDITAATLSNDNNIWLYNNSKRKLQKYSIQGKLLYESLDLLGITNFSTMINFIQESENNVFLTTESHNIIMLDNLGRFKKDLPFIFESPFHSAKKQICGKYKQNYACLEVTDGIMDEPRDVVRVDAKGVNFMLYKMQMYTSFPKGIVRTPIIY